MNLANFVGLDKVAGELIKGLDGLFTSDEERIKAELLVRQTMQQPHILQALTNLEAAKHGSTFVAGARPALLWVCVCGIGWQYVLRPLMESIAILLGFTGTLTNLDITDIVALTIALLGLGGMRTLEGLNGVKRNNMDDTPLPPIKLQGKSGFGNK